MCWQTKKKTEGNAGLRETIAVIYKTICKIYDLCMCRFKMCAAYVYVCMIVCMYMGGVWD